VTAITTPSPLLRAVVVADGDVDPLALERALAASPGARLFLVGADGGARKAHAAGLRPDLVVGDGDSLDADTAGWIATAGIEWRAAARAKDESDTELAVLAALAEGAAELRIVGALGGLRPEHSLANLLLLAHPSLDGIDAAILTATSSHRRVGSARGPGAIEIEGAPGDWVSLLALDGRVEGVTTTGLRFPLHDEPLDMGPARGLSNELTGTSARVTTRKGRLLVIHTQRTPGGPP
jgi:thiamine pyrophosphokinase